MMRVRGGNRMKSASRIAQRGNGTGLRSGEIAI